MGRFCVKMNQTGSGYVQNKDQSVEQVKCNDKMMIIIIIKKQFLDAEIDNSKFCAWMRI